MDWETSTCGQVVTVVRTMIAIVMATQPVCGPSPSTPPSITARMLTMMKVAPRLSRPPSAMERKIPTQEW